MVKIEHTGPEFCIHCYNQRYVEIQKKWEKKEKARTKKARTHGYTPAQVESLREILRSGMKRDILRLDQEWEEMWCA